VDALGGCGPGGVPPEGRETSGASSRNQPASDSFGKQKILTFQKSQLFGNVRVLTDRWSAFLKFGMRGMGAARAAELERTGNFPWKKTGWFLLILMDVAEFQSFVGLEYRGWLMFRCSRPFVFQFQVVERSKGCSGFLGCVF
jgi:hypothetical protein